jgi:uncharacterized protein YeaO (DUF488 family)
MTIRAKSLAEPPAPEDGLRVLITRFRPRGVRKGAETWATWDRRLAPSAALLDLYRGKRREHGRVVARGLEPLPWDEFTRRYEAELAGPDGQAALAEWRARAAGETVTLLCHCEDEARCHRGLAARLLRARGRPARA